MLFARPAIVLAAVAALTMATGVAYADLGPAPSAPGYPTWSDVEAARSSVAKTNAEVAVVQAALQRAQSEAAAASATAVNAQQAASQADAALAAATTRADTLSSAASAASAAASTDSSTAGALAATLYRTQANGMLVMQLLTSHDNDRLLERLGVLDNVTTWWNTTTKDAMSAQAVATSLRDSAEEAQKARATLSAKAHEASDAATAASEHADTVAAAAQQHTDTLYAQLAVLKGSTAATERRYVIGVKVAAQAAAEQAARERAAQEAAARAAAQEAARRQQPSSSGNASGGSFSGSSGGSSGGGSSSNWTPPAGAGSVSPGAAQAYARQAIGAYGWGGGQFSCLISLWDMESGWRWNAMNPSSGAYGIPQALPADKLAAAGPDWRTSASTQIDWGLAYISNRYGTPCAAWNHEMSEWPHWY